MCPGCWHLQLTRRIDEMMPVADFSLSSLVAVSADVSPTTTVVAFLALAAVLCHMACNLEKVKFVEYRNHRRRSKSCRCHCSRLVDHRILHHHSFLHSWGNCAQCVQSCHLRLTFARTG